MRRLYVSKIEERITEEFRDKDMGALERLRVVPKGGLFPRYQGGLGKMNPLEQVLGENNLLKPGRLDEFLKGGYR